MSATVQVHILILGLRALCQLYKAKEITDEDYGIRSPDLPQFTSRTGDENIKIVTKRILCIKLFV
jgi:hypothetical protein